MAFPGTVQIPIQFSGGLNSKIAEFSLDQPYLQEAKNAVFNVAGQIDKRTGLSAISNKIQGGGNISAGHTLTTFNNELLLCDGTNLYSYQDEEEVWIDRGSLFSTTNDQIRVLNTKVATQSNPDCTSADNITMYVWEDNRTFPLQANGVRYSIINNETGTIIVPDQIVYQNGTRPKVVCDGTTFYALYNASADSILYNTVPVARPNLVSSQYNQICTNGKSPSTSAAISYDACIFNGELLVAYASTAGLRLNTDYGTHVISNNTNINTIAMCVDSFNNVWVAWSDSSNTYIGAWEYIAHPMPPLHAGFFQVLGQTTINKFQANVSVNLAIIEHTDLGSANLTCETYQAGNNNYINNYVISANGISTFIGQQRGVGLASKPFKYDNNVFINTVWQSAYQATYFTQCLTQGAQFVTGTSQIQAANNYALATSFNIVAKHSPQNGGNYRTNSLLSQADPVSSSEFIFAGQRKGPFTSYETSQTANLGVAGYSIGFGDANAFNNVSANNNLHIIGGIKKIYDGVSCVEDNFNVYPENSDGYGCNIVNITNTDGYNALTSAVSGSLTYNPLTQPNQYQWLVVYEWTDNFGQVQRSSPSGIIGAVTTAVGQGAHLVGPTLRLTEKVQPRSSVIISIFRTQDSLPIFYKITDDNNPLVNDPTVDTWTFIDTLSDVGIAPNENLYTGSQLANIAPPPCSLISLYQQRLMINSTEDPGVLWYSQNKFEQDQYNTLALDFNTSFVEGVDSRYGNEITAIGLLDNNLAIFKETSIFILQGDGPNSLDTSGQFNDAALLVSDTGCTNQNSLVFITQTPTLPGGLLFKSAKGIYLLGRDETIYYIGAPVEKYNNLTITSANLLSKSNQVVWTTLEGTALVYNYYFNAWSTWENLPAVSACIWQDQLCILTNEGTVMIQDGTGSVFKDTYASGVIEPIPLSITTPWIKMNGLQNYMSIFNCLLLGTLQGPHILNVQTAYDYNPSITASVLINSSVATNRWGSNPVWGSLGMWGQDQFSNYQFQINFNNPRCQAIQLTISDVDNPAYTQGYSLNGLVLECLTLPAGMRLPTSNKAGVS
jgi:hypothetical protein